MTLTASSDVATEFIRSFRRAEFGTDGQIDQWSILGRTVAQRAGAQAWMSAGRAPGFGGPVQVTTDMLMPMRVYRQMFVDAVAPLVSVDRRGGRMFLVPTMGELTAAFSATESNDVEDFGQTIGLTEVDVLLAERLWTRTARSRPHEQHPRHVSEADYVALRAAAHQTDAEYVLALLDAGIPANAVIQLCALPPMPVEYAIAMFNGGES